MHSHVAQSANTQSANMVVHIKATHNNLIITVSDLLGNTLFYDSAGAKFKGPKRGTPFAGGAVATAIATKIMSSSRGRHVSVSVNVKGPGMGREAAIRALSAAGIQVLCIKDVTPLPHNGCKPPKTRRP